LAGGGGGEGGRGRGQVKSLDRRKIGVRVVDWRSHIQNFSKVSWLLNVLRQLTGVLTFEKFVRFTLDVHPARVCFLAQSCDGDAVGELLQRVAVCCSVLQCVAVCVFESVATFCGVQVYRASFV